MSIQDLLTDPQWADDALGLPLPPSNHAVSVALPRWEHVVGYEEKRPEVMDRLEGGYPRFVILQTVRALSRRVCGSDSGLVFPSETTARRAARFVERYGKETAEVIFKNALWAVRVRQTGWASLKAFWQHAGWIVSTRQAEASLSGKPAPSNSPQLRCQLKKLLAGFYACETEDVFLTPTGMAAQDLALRALMRRAPGRPTLQLGFPYVDTLKLQERLGNGATLLHSLDSIEDELNRALQTATWAGAFAEIPGNPLLGSADLRRIEPVLRAAHVPLVADDVVATPLNVDLRAYADLVATSLTKYVVGTGEAMGGAVVCNPASPFYSELKALVSDEHEDLLWPGDAEVLLQQASSFPERMKHHNTNGLYIAERLRHHPAIERVWYPKWEFSHVYEAVRRPEGGWGSLITFLPRNAPERAPLIYDRLKVCKGPSLGTIFTLACPFTLLAHYTELEWAEQCGVSRYLIRLSIGLEDPEELWSRIAHALDPHAA